MSEDFDPRTHLFVPKKDQTPTPEYMIAVLRWSCPSCREFNPFDESMNDEIVACLTCGKLARPHQDLSNTPLLPSESAKARKLLEW